MRRFTMKSLPRSLLTLEPGVRWAARVLAVLLVAMVLWFLVAHVAEGGLNEFRLTLKEAVLMVLLLTTCIGLVLAWRWSLIGGATATAGMILFYAVEFFVSGHRPLNNLYFNLMLFTGILFLLSAIIRRRVSVG
jgi:hypothetical protein